jgi:integrase
MAQSSARTYAAMVKSVMNDYREEMHIPCKRDEEILTIKKAKTISAYIEEKEIKKLSEYKPKTPEERFVLNIFLLGCLTGARHSDCVTFNRGNIMGGNLIYVSEKTKIKASIPLSPLAVRLIDDTPNCTPVNDANFNLSIRRICKSLGFKYETKVYKAGQYVQGEKWRFISSHTARRSFATNLYLRGADLYSISKMMGHSDTSMTEGYICCGLREQSEKILQYFQKFK